MKSRTILDSIRANAIPAAMIGVGVFLLVRPRTETTIDFDADFDVSGSTAERTSRIRDIAAERAAQSYDLVSSNPMIAGVAALALGAIAGAVIPETRKEHELLGDTRDRVAQRARDAARERIQNITSTVTDAIKGSGNKTDVGQNIGIGSNG